MGVLCATLWFSGSEWVRTCSEPLPEHMLNSPKPNVGGSPQWQMIFRKTRRDNACISMNHVPVTHLFEYEEFCPNKYIQS
ncbi:hypothetical protein EDC04DRAFT_2689195 [Pisolithus marmoratus]|nr:hypothetical protein EDC04DRAFT_2689195 [Pisolithus marmoratus]